MTGCDLVGGWQSESDAMGGRHHQHLTAPRHRSASGPSPGYDTSLRTSLLERMRGPPLQGTSPREKEKALLPWPRIPQESLEHQAPAKPARERTR